MRLAMSSELVKELHRQDILRPYDESGRLIREAAARLEALEAENARLREIVDAVEQHENSNFYGPDVDKNRRASWRGVMRKIKSARRAREGGNADG